jgi:hypothetical protein
MKLIVGPILKRAGGYVFDTWSVCEGLNLGIPYRRIEDASYARNAALRAGQPGAEQQAVACYTVDDFKVLISGGGVLTAA